MAIIATTVVAMGLTLTGGLATLAQTVVLLLLFVFISTNLAVLVLRKDHVEQEHFRAPTFLPVAALASCVLLLTQQGPEIWLRGGILLAIGIILYLLTRLGSGSRTGTNQYKKPTEQRTGDPALDAGSRPADDVEPH